MSIECGSLFEIWIALQLRDSGCSFDIIMPPSQHASFEHTLLHDADSIAESLSRVDLQNAEATVEADKLTIHQLVTESIGFETVNEEVLAAMRGWVAAAAEDALTLIPEAARATNETAAVLM